MWPAAVALVVALLGAAVLFASRRARAARAEDPDPAGSGALEGVEDLVKKPPSARNAKPGAGTAKPAAGKKSARAPGGAALFTPSSLAAAPKALAAPKPASNASTVAPTPAPLSPLREPAPAGPPPGTESQAIRAIANAGSESGAMRAAELLAALTAAKAARASSDPDRPLDLDPALPRDLSAEQKARVERLLGKVKAEFQTILTEEKRKSREG